MARDVRIVARNANTIFGDDMPHTPLMRRVRRALLLAAEILADLGIAAPQGLVRSLGPKLLIPQACYRARSRRMRFAARRRAIAARLARLGVRD